MLCEERMTGSKLWLDMVAQAWNLRLGTPWCHLCCYEDTLTTSSTWEKGFTLAHSSRLKSITAGRHGIEN